MLKSYRFLSVCLLIFLIILSSCAVKRGINYFLSGQTSDYTAPGKTAKPILVYKQAVSFYADCKVLFDAKNDLASVAKPQALVNTVTPFLYFILPGFLISLLLVFKDHVKLPVPYALLNWSALPLFLQNRLLLL